MMSTKARKRAALKQMRPARSLGRPRADGRPPITRAQILDTASELFAKLGVSGTSIRDIADKLGIHTASVFYLFATKEDIVSEVATRLCTREVEHFNAIRALALAPDVTLYKVIRDDALFSASGEGDQRRLFMLPELRSPRFPQVAAVAETVVQSYGEILREGVKAGQFLELPLRATAEAINSIAVTGALSWKPQLIGTPREIGRDVARFALRSVLARPARLDAIERKALSIHIEATKSRPLIPDLQRGFK
jgi:AcrR family transcriptional regulator